MSRKYANIYSWSDVLLGLYYFIALGLLLGLTGNLTNMPDVITYGLLLTIGGVILVAVV